MGIDQYLLVIWSVLSTLTVVKASENLAHGKATNQSSVFEDKSWDSSKAVDGCLSTSVYSHCCTHTAGEQTEAWWQVDLQTQSVMHTVDIIYRDENTLRRLAGYEIYLSDAPDWTSGTRCHKDDTPDLASMSATQNVQCPGVARYLTIYNDRRVKAKDWYSNDAVLELCEVQVYGCPIGKYGNGNCNNTCFNCLGNICDTSSGICDTCANGYYNVGTVCSSCPFNCAGNTCDSVSGTCSAGCKSGYSGTWCRCPVNCKDSACPTSQCTDCNASYYGPACTPCSSGCIGSTCDKNTGQCSDCKDGYYGQVCTPCPIGCSGNTCDKTTGHCLTECVAGFYGNSCDQQCPENCIDNLCIQGNGVCTQCVPGWYGSTCDQGCSVNCKDKLCHQGNGFCTQCTSGYYGDLCVKNCPSNCKDSSCNKASGVCIGCVTGYHGSNCSLNCPDNCKDRNCIQDNGQCTECSPGFHGNNCEDMCCYCQDGRCDRDTGNCVTSCIEGITGHRCGVKEQNVAAIGIGIGCGVVIVVLIIVIIILVRRQRSIIHQNNTRSTTMTDISLPNVGQDQQYETDGTYEIIETETREENVMNKPTRDSSYEQLGERTKDVPHIYDTT